jgi:hypothetical protein
MASTEKHERQGVFLPLLEDPNDKPLRLFLLTLERDQSSVSPISDFFAEPQMTVDKVATSLGLDHSPEILHVDDVCQLGFSWLVEPYVDWPVVDTTILLYELVVAANLEVHLNYL